MTIKTTSKITLKKTMATKTRCGIFVILVAIGGTMLAFSAPAESGAEDAATKATPVAVEDDMHEFMEYMFEPPYKRLKAGLAKAPEDRSAWKGIKSDSLILAEAANLLLHRHPTDDATAWSKHAMAVRKQGGELYQAAKKRDFELSQNQFAALLKNCNQCHDQFAGGEHQLAP